MSRNQSSKWHRTLSFVLALFLLLQVSSLVVAQSAEKAALRGTVSGPSGAPVANATVTAINVENGQTRTATTGANGDFNFEDLAPGQYRLKFEAAGFTISEISSRTLSRAHTAVV